MKNITTNLILVSILLVSCSKSPIQNSVIEPLEIDEIEHMIDYEISQEDLIIQELYKDGTIETHFERFYEKAQNFHRYINNDNLTKLKFKDLKYKDYNLGNNYLHAFDLGGHGMIYDDSIKILVDDGAWKDNPIYLSIFDTLSSAQRVRELIKKYPSVYIEWEVEEAMQIWLKKEIERKNDSIWEIYKNGKSNKIKLLEEFESKCWDLEYENR
tara:strand:+ start:84 stop:722 length:639 start_codon:yes stop_codon:yes gene_type:complete